MYEHGSVWTIESGDAASVDVNGTFTTDTAGWSASGSNTIARSSAQAKVGPASLACTYQNNATLVSRTLSLPVAARTTVRAWVYAPAAFNATTLTLAVSGFTGATGTTSDSADLTADDVWQLLEFTFTPDSGDLEGTLALSVTGTPSAGVVVYLDEVECEQNRILVTFNDGSSGIYLEETSGFDGAAIRTSLEDVPEGDGALAGDSYLSHRPVTLRGKIGVALSASARNELMADLQRACRGLRSQVTLKSEASGMPAMQVAARLAEPPRFSGGYVKEFLIAFVCPDPRIYSQELHAETDAGQVTSPGAPFPWSFPVDFGGVSGATVQVTCENAGNFDTPPVLRATGPIANPLFALDNTGEAIYVDGVTLAAGEWVEVDMAARTVVDNNGSSRYRYVRFPGSTWWQLKPGDNVVQLWGSGSDATTRLHVSWRDAWA